MHTDLWDEPLPPRRRPWRERLARCLLALSRRLYRWVEERQAGDRDGD